MKPKLALFGKLTLLLVMVAAPVWAENKFNPMTGELKWFRSIISTTRPTGNETMPCQAHSLRSIAPR